jgi:lipopolysaccharide exporter
MIRQAIHLTIGNLVSRCVFASLTIIVAKLVSPESYGAFSYAIATVSLASYFCDLGLQSTYLRQVAGGGPRWSDYTITSFFLRGALFTVVCAVAAIFLSRLALTPETLRCVALMFVPGVLGLALTSWITGTLLSRSDTRTLVIARLKAAAAQAVCVAIGMTIPVGDIPRAEVLAFCYGFGLMCGGLFGIRAVPVKSYWISRRRIKHCAARLGTGLHGYTISGFFYMLAPTLGVLILERRSSLAVVGTFALVSRVPQFLYTIPGSVGQAFYPKLFQAVREQQWTTFSALVRKEASFLLAIGAALALTVVASGPLIAHLLGHSSGVVYQREFSNALLVGAAVIFVQSMSIPLGHALETAGCAMQRTVGQAISLSIAAVLFAQLGAQHGVVGAMIAAVTGEAVLYVAWLVLLAVYVRQAKVVKLLLPSLCAAVAVLGIGCGIWYRFLR